MNTQAFTPPPRWLPLRLLLGGLAAGVLMVAFCGQDWRTLSGAHFEELGLRCAHSLAVLAVALLLALTLGIAAGVLARGCGRPVEAFVGFLGRALACMPVVVVAWGFVSLWIGEWGWPVETLLPAQLPELKNARETLPGRVWWEHLAPSLVLALPLVGEMIHAITADATMTADLDFSLRARGVPDGRRLWHHHLLQMLPLAGTRMQSLCLVAPVYLIVVEDVLHFMGWGGWMAQGIRDGDALVIALGFVSGGMLMALLCAGFGGLSRCLRPSCGLLPTLSWQPWLLWALGWMTVPPQGAVVWLIMWLAALITSGAGWIRAWGEVAGQLPVEAAKMLGAADDQIWRTHIKSAQLRMLAAWFGCVCAQTLLWMALALAVRPALIGTLGKSPASWLHPLAVVTMEDAARTLTDPLAMLHTGGGVMLAALCLLQVSRIIQPRPF